MTDPLRTESSRTAGAASDADRDRKIEQLLLAGLDHYFAAEYEQAINVWTRALFLDRSHARARAYIDRARSALAERQREGEELLQHGIAAFNRGAPDEARRLLKAAMSGGAPSDEALALLDRLDRLEMTAGVPVQASAATRPKAAPSKASVIRVGIAVFVLGAAIFITATRPTWQVLLGTGPVAASAPIPSASVESVPLPRRGEIALSRARALTASGKLRDALAALERVRPTDPEKADADRLRAEIQRHLIALATQSTAPATDEPTVPHQP